MNIEKIEKMKKLVIPGICIIIGILFLITAYISAQNFVLLQYIIDINTGLRFLYLIGSGFIGWFIFKKGCELINRAKYISYVIIIIGLILSINCFFAGSAYILLQYESLPAVYLSIPFYLVMIAISLSILSRGLSLYKLANNNEFTHNTPHMKSSQVLLIPDPESISDMIHLGRSLANNEKFVDALQIFDNILEKNPDSAEALNDSGVILYRLGKIEDAKSRLTQAITYDNKNEEYRSNLKIVNMIIEFEKEKKPEEETKSTYYDSEE